MVKITNIDAIREKYKNLNAENVNKEDGRGRTALHYTAANGDEQFVRSLLGKGGDANKQDKFGYTALHLAVLNNHVGIVRALLGRGGNADVNIKTKKKETAFDLAMQMYLIAEKGHTELMNDQVEIMVELLKSEKIAISKKTQEATMYLAAEKGYTELVGVLLEKGVDLNKKNKSGKTALNIAVINGHTEVIEKLLQHKNIDINKRDKAGNTALHWAILHNRDEIVERLLNNKKIKVNLKNRDGDNALHFAAANGKIDIVKKLVKMKGINLNERNKDGQTALYLAAANGHLNVVEELLKHKDVKVSVKDKEGYTALHLAAVHGHTDIVQKLLEEKTTNINQKNNYGNTALRLAARNDKKAADLLVNKLNENLTFFTVYKNVGKVSAASFAFNKMLQAIGVDSKADKAELVIKDKTVKLSYSKSSSAIVNTNSHKADVDTSELKANKVLKDEDKDNGKGGHFIG